MGLETTAHEVYSTRSYTAGLDRLTVETRWEETSTVRQKLAFALHSDKNATIEAWLKGGSRRSAAFHVCNNGVHAGSTRDRADEVNAVRAAVKDLHQTVTSPPPAANREPAGARRTDSGWGGPGAGRPRPAGGSGRCSSST